MKLSLPLDGGVWLVPNDTLIEILSVVILEEHAGTSRFQYRPFPHVHVFGADDQSESDLLLYERVDFSGLQRVHSRGCRGGLDDGLNFSLTRSLRSPVESMSIFVKPKLKALKECLASKDWEGVHKNAK